jgi:hypothetical protein
MSNNVPDVISSSTDVPPPDPVANAASAEMVPMETDDVVAQSAAVSSNTISSSANNVTSTAVTTQNVRNGGDINAVRQRLEDQELEITGELSATAYGELLLIYLVQFKINDAKYCYMRAAEKHNENYLKTIWKIGAAIAKNEYVEAIHLCNATQLNSALQSYITELAQRLRAIQVQLISKCYASIEKANVAKLMGISADSDDFAQLIGKCGWTVNGAFVHPSETSESKAFVTSLINKEFGEFKPTGEDKTNEKDGTTKSTNDIETLKKLVVTTDFFDFKASA